MTHGSKWRAREVRYAFVALGLAVLIVAAVVWYIVANRRPHVVERVVVRPSPTATRHAPRKAAPHARSNPAASRPGVTPRPEPARSRVVTPRKRHRRPEGGAAPTSRPVPHPAPSTVTRTVSPPQPSPTPDPVRSIICTVLCPLTGGSQSG